jgi:hypothetical protein
MRGDWGQLFISKAQVLDLVRRKQFGCCGKSCRSEAVPAGKQSIWPANWENNAT